MIALAASKSELRVRVTDQGGDRSLSAAEPPDLEAKLAGLQTPRGWGLYLIEKMVDGMRVSSDQTGHTVELILHLRGTDDAG